MCNTIFHNYLTYGVGIALRGKVALTTARLLLSERSHMDGQVQENARVGSGAEPAIHRLTHVHATL